MLPPDASGPARSSVPRLYSTATQRQLEGLWVRSCMCVAFRQSDSVWLDSRAQSIIMSFDRKRHVLPGMVAGMQVACRIPRHQVMLSLSRNGIERGSEHAARKPIRF
jgi:hypothetical protein